MKITNKQIIDSYNALTSLQEVELPISASFKLTKNKKALEEAYQPYDIEFKKLDEKFPVKEDGNGGKYREQEFFDSVSELQKIEVDVDIEVIPVDSFGNIQISIHQLESIQFMLD
jgi:predicted RNA-binding protein with RPS1 domain